MRNSSVTDKLSWSKSLFAENPLFADLLSFVDFDQWYDRPSAAELNDCLPSGLYNQNAKPIQFHQQDDTLPFPQLYYENRVFEHGIVATRDNWHDFFNALIWRLFPATKSALNAAHLNEIARQSDGGRSALRDALTHFDECGAIIASADPGLIQQIQQHEWERVFYEQKTQWNKCIRAYIFGHATYECGLAPYIGMTAKATFVEVEKDFFNAPMKSQYAELDQRVAKELNKGERIHSNRSLSPLPVLGVPGWHMAAQNLAFYQDTNYFRPKSK